MFTLLNNSNTIGLVPSENDERFIGQLVELQGWTSSRVVGKVKVKLERFERNYVRVSGMFGREVKLAAISGNVPLVIPALNRTAKLPAWTYRPQRLTER